MRFIISVREREREREREVCLVSFKKSNFICINLVTKKLFWYFREKK